MRFSDLLSRSDSSLLCDLFGFNVIKLLGALHGENISLERIRTILLDLYPPYALLKDKKKRRALLQLLREQEAYALADTLEIKNTRDVFETLTNLQIQEKSVRFSKLLSFFDLPILEKREQSLDIAPIDAKPDYELFPHQRDAIRRVGEKLSYSPHRVVLHMPTGSGKTRTAMNAVANYLRSNEPLGVLWLANSEELCGQAVEEFTNAWKFLGNRHIRVQRHWGPYELAFEDRFDGIIVAGFAKTYSRVINSPSWLARLGDSVSYIVVDEAHQVIAPTYKLIVDGVTARNHQTRLLGLTATPGRTWSDIEADEDLANFFSRNKVTLQIDGYTNPIEYLIDEGYIARPNFVELKLNHIMLTESEKLQVVEEFEIPESILSRLAADEVRTLKILQSVERLVSLHNRILVFATTVEHAELLSALLHSRGINSRCVTGKTHSIERNDIISWYRQRSDDVRVILNYGVLSTGFDAPQTSAAVIARPTKSLVLFSQMVGRATRGVRAGGNKEAEIVTVVDLELPGFRNISEAFTNWEDVWE